MHNGGLVIEMTLLLWSFIGMQRMSKAHTHHDTAHSCVHSAWQNKFKARRSFRTSDELVPHERVELFLSRRLWSLLRRHRERTWRLRTELQPSLNANSWT